MAFEGMSGVLGNLNKEISKIKGRKMAGLMAVGLLIEGRAAKRVPVHKGKLRASKYTRKETENSVVVGFSAVYARRIHENLEQKWKGQPRKGRNASGVYWGPNGEPRFLSKAFNETKKEAPQIIRSYTLVGK